MAGQFANCRSCGRANDRRAPSCGGCGRPGPRKIRGILDLGVNRAQLIGLIALGFLLLSAAGAFGE